jgi:hypothetical protein
MLHHFHSNNFVPANSINFFLLLPIDPIAGSV